MKFLVIGLGSIGTRHARNLLALGHEVWGLEADGRDITKILPGLRGPSTDEIRQVDAFVICTPTFLHAQQMEWAYGLDKHVFVEKPIATKCSDLAFPGNEKVVTVVGNNLRFHPSARLARRYIKEGAIGQPIWAHICVAQYNNKPEYLRDGVTLNWGAHEIDLALWLLGPATVQAASIDKADTIADICLLHESGCRSVIHLDYLTKSEVRDTIVIGERGRVDVSLLLRAVILKQGDRINPPDRQEGLFDTDYENEMIAFVNAVQGKPWIGATAQDGIEVLKIIDAAKEMAGLPIYEKDLPTAEDVKGILR